MPQAWSNAISPQLASFQKINSSQIHSPTHDANQALVVSVLIRISLEMWSKEAGKIMLSTRRAIVWVTTA
jgi:hypothetical protein